jgi:DnaJ-domain-containing protein 1
VNLPGLLAATTLGDLLGRLYRGGVNGVLELVERDGHSAGRAHRIHFDRGLIDEVETPLSVPRLGEVLIRLGALSDESLGRARPRLGDGRARRIGETLVAERLVTRSAVRYALHSQLGLRLEALFQIKDALIRFHIRRARRNEAEAPEPLSPREFLNGRPRKRAAGSPSLRSAPSDTKRAALSVLGLGPGAEGSEIRQAFRRLASESHPDRYPDAGPERRAELLRRFAELSRAYHALVKA